MKTVNSTEDIDVAGLVVLDFWAAWCGPCRSMAPALQEVSDTVTNINFYKINADENTDIVLQYGVMSLPTLLVLKDGVEIKRLVGAKSKDELTKELVDTL